MQVYAIWNWSLYDWQSPAVKNYFQKIVFSLWCLNSAKTIFFIVVYESILFLTE